MNPSPTTAPSVSESPTRVRYGVLGFACSLSMITYLDRVCFGSVARFITFEFDLSNTQKGMLFSAFALAYAAFEVPSGWLGDVFGPRRTLIRIVVWWSLFTALTGMIYPTETWPHFAFLAMLAVRFFFGMGEAGAYPNIARAFHNWFPFGERAFAQGAVWMAGRFAGGITPLIVLALISETTRYEQLGLEVAKPRSELAQQLKLAKGKGLVITDVKPGSPAAKAGLQVQDVLVKVKFKDKENKYEEKDVTDDPAALEKRFANATVTILRQGQQLNIDGVTIPESDVSWRHMFWIFGSLGVLWCILFWWWFRDRPEQKAAVNRAEIELIQRESPPEAAHAGVPWGKLLTNRNLWILCMMYFCAAYGWYLNITFLPDLLRDYYEISPGEKGSWEFWRFSLATGAPLLIGSLACLLGGIMSDAFIRRTGNRKWGRRLFGVIGHGLCALCYFTAILANNPWFFVGAVAFAAFWNDITMGAAWASCLDIGGRYSGIVAGCMNTIGNLGGFAAGFLTGWILDAAQESGGAKSMLGVNINLLIFGTVYLIAMVLWLFFDSTKPVVEAKGS